MSTIRVLVGTKKGAFILTADGTRKNWQVNGPLFGGWEMYHLKASPVDPNRIYASQTSGWFGQIIQRSDDGGKTWNPPGTKPEDLMGPDGMPKGVSNQFLYEGETGMHMHYDGTQKPWALQAHLAHRAVAHRPGHGLRGRGGHGDFQDHRRRQDVEGTVRLAAGEGPPLATRRGRHGLAHHPARPDEPEPHLHRHFGGGRVSHR